MINLYFVSLFEKLAEELGTPRLSSSLSLGSLSSFPDPSCAHSCSLTSSLPPSLPPSLLLLSFSLSPHCCRDDAVPPLSGGTRAQAAFGSV